LRLKAYIDQKNEKEVLQVITTLLGRDNLTIRNKVKAFYRVELSSKKALKFLCDYFSKHKLRSKKHIVYAMWKKFANLFITGQHLEALKPKYFKFFKRRVAKIKYQNAQFKRDKTVLKNFTTLL